MGPELIVCRQLGFGESRQTEHSDCYSLGMVIYGTIRNNPQTPTAFMETMEGDIPLMSELSWSFLRKTINKLGMS